MRVVRFPTRAATPKSCRDLVTYLARYPATRRGDVRLMPTSGSDSVGMVWFWLLSGWVSICVPNRTTSGGAVSSDLLALSDRRLVSGCWTSRVTVRAPCWIRVASSAADIGGAQAGPVAQRRAPPPHVAAGP